VKKKIRQHLEDQKKGKKKKTHLQQGIKMGKLYAKDERITPREEEKQFQSQYHGKEEMRKSSRLPR